MAFYKLDPEVAGGWGPHTKFNRTAGKPTVVYHLHYQFDGWLGGERLESCSCFIVTERLAKLLQSRNLSGYELKPVEISTSEQFRDYFPDLELPRFVWLDITGTAGVDDFGLSAGALVVSTSAFDSLKSGSLKHCEVSEFS